MFSAERLCVSSRTQSNSDVSFLQRTTHSMLPLSFLSLSFSSSSLTSCRRVLKLRRRSRSWSCRIRVVFVWIWPKVACTLECR